MYKFLILTPVLVMLGAGSALAFDASRGFGPSDANDQPVPRFQTGTSDNRSVDRSAVTSGTAKVRTGYPARASRDNADRVYRGWLYRGRNASDDFSASY